jgi:hypothetical protein
VLKSFFTGSPESFKARASSALDGGVRTMSFDSISTRWRSKNASALRHVEHLGYWNTFGFTALERNLSARVRRGWK